MVCRYVQPTANAPSFAATRTTLSACDKAPNGLTSTQWGRGRFGDDAERQRAPMTTGLRQVAVLTHGVAGLGAAPLTCLGSPNLVLGVPLLIPALE